MLDIKMVRANPDLVKQAMKTRNKDMDAQVDRVIAIDAERRELSAKADGVKARQNAASKDIARLKKEGGDASAIMDEMKRLAEEGKELSARAADLETEQRNILLSIPNIPHASVPVGKDDTENVEQRRWGEPRAFDFEPEAHWDIGKRLELFDPEVAAKITGKRFHVYKGLGARLERSIINFFLNTHTENGYTEILPPFMVNRASMTGTGQLPKFEEDAFKLTDPDYFLIPTAEVPVTNMHRDEILDGASLPIKYCATAHFPPASAPRRAALAGIPAALFVSTSSIRWSSSSLPIPPPAMRNSIS